MRNLLIVIAASILLSSCEKEVNIDLNSSDPQVVIEGSITDAPGPYYVKISKSVNFSEPNSYPPITGALVVISDNLGNRDTLTEISPGTYQTHTIVGAVGNTYHLNITAQQKQYSATSTMPAKVNLDSVKFSRSSVPGGDEQYSVLPVYTDPPTLGNNYRYLLTVNGELDNSYLVDNDGIGNGLVNKRIIFSPDLEIKLNDTVKVEMRCIDLPTYTYFYTLSQITGGGPGGGTAPTNPPNNIVGDKALGFFAAYTTQALTQVVQ